MIPLSFRIFEIFGLLKKFMNDVLLFDESNDSNIASISLLELETTSTLPA